MMRLIAVFLILFLPGQVLAGPADVQINVGFGLLTHHFDGDSFKDERHPNSKPERYNQGTWMNNRLMGLFIRHEDKEAGFLAYNNTYGDPVLGGLGSKFHNIAPKWEFKYGAFVSHGYKKPVKKNGQVVAYKTGWSVAPKVGVRYQLFQRLAFEFDVYAKDVGVLALLVRFD